MQKSPAVRALFLDVGGVLLTNGWDRRMRKQAAEAFGIDYEEMDERHNLTFSIYEAGKLTLREYLDQAVFYTARPFTYEQFRDFMFAQSKPYQDMIGMMQALKGRYELRIAAVSNEGRELTMYRIRKFGLMRFIDSYIASCFVHYRKPDKDIYRMALDIAQVSPGQVLYVDDRPLFVEAAQKMGMKVIHHTAYESSRRELGDFGLSIAESPLPALA